jgi:putative helicase MOV10L1
MARVNDPRRDPVSVKQDVINFCAEPASDAALHARVVVAT